MAESFIKELVTRNTEIRFRSPEDTDIRDTDIVVHDRTMFDRIITKGEIAFAEAYMDGAWTCNNLELLLSELLTKYHLLQNAIENRFFNFLTVAARTKFIEWTQNNNLSQASRNVQHHYDIGNDLYVKMLGSTMQYSCAYYYRPNLTLDEAQLAKMELIAQKLDLQPGMNVLDIGCGFGALAHHLASNYGVKVVGVTLSKEQKKFAESNFSHANVSICLLDYRLLDEDFKYDRIYSVGMFEHVGRNHYAEYYNKCYNLLTDDGIMLLHTIGTSNRNWDKNNFINEYIFPGAELPHLANLTDKYTDRWHLEDLHNFGISYAKTLRAWRAKLDNWESLENYDTRFRRMWEFYLASCAAYFQLRKICLWQLVYTKQNSKRTDNCHHIRHLTSGKSEI